MSARPLDWRWRLGDVGMVLMGLSICLLAFHAYTLARWGYWDAWPTLRIAYWVGLDEWARSPRDWLGIRAALLWLPLWCLLLNAGVIALVASNRLKRWS